MELETVVALGRTGSLPDAVVIELDGVAAGRVGVRVPSTVLRGTGPGRVVPRHVA